MTEMLLKQSYAVGGVIFLHHHNGKGIAQPVRADVMYFPRLRILEAGQPRPSGASTDYLPGAVAVDAE